MIPRKQNYKTTEEILQNVLIYEYDMNKAGLSLLKEYSDIPLDYLNSLEKMDKLKRNIEIGQLMKYNKDYKKAVEGNIIDVMQEFFRVNELDITNIISIKRDSVFSTKKCNVLQLTENITFKLVDVYSSYYRFGDVEFYFSTNKNDFVIKGLGKSVENNLFLIEFKKLIKSIERSNKSNRYRILVDFRKKYCNKEFPIEMYRELNPENRFRITTKSYSFLSDSFDDLKVVNGVYNYTKFLVPLIKNST